MNSFLEDLKKRGLISQITNEEQVIEELNKQSSLYCGFDPTADSLHVGSLLPLITLLRFKKAGHKIIPLIGGATGLIGDPSFKSTERVLNNEDTVEHFKNSIIKQIKNILGQDIEVVDNLEWTKNISALDFLRDIGKFFSVNAMISKESVKNRIERAEQGISFTEFSYQLLQGLDFWKLFSIHNCTIQLGGSDQWGNIISGIDLIHKKEGNKAIATGITMPLVTKSDGTKFGKTESGAVWLSDEKTSPFKFFQFWLGLPDEDTKKLFKLFSFRTLEEIEDIFKNDLLRVKPIAQQLLAEEMTQIVHGSKELKAVLNINKALFSGNFDLLSKEDFLELQNNGIPILYTQQKNIIDLLMISKLTESKRIARELIKNGAITLNGKKIGGDSFEEISNLSINEEDLLHNKYIILKRGKNKFIIVEYL